MMLLNHAGQLPGLAGSLAMDFAVLYLHMRAGSPNVGQPVDVFLGAVLGLTKHCPVQIVRHVVPDSGQGQY
jgi:hypothetical protein